MRSNNCFVAVTKSLLNTYGCNLQIPSEPYSKTEVNGKFKIMQTWDEKLNDRESPEFKEMANTITRGIEEMLEADENLSGQADFEVEILGFKYGVVDIRIVC